MDQGIAGAAYTTPLGTVVAIASPSGLRSLSFELEDLERAEQVFNPVLATVAEWLGVYFSGAFSSLPELPLDLPTTPSSPAWMATREIPAGQTITYGQLAGQLGRSAGSARAIGAAMSANPALLVLPCHRVVAATGSLAGYRGGVQRKAWLLRHEGALLL